MTSLYENLPALEAAAHETGPLMDDLLRHGQEAERAGTALAERIEEARGEVDALERDAEAALATLAQAASAGQARIEQGASEVGAASDGLQRELHQTEEEMAAGARTADESIDALAERMRSAGTEAEGEEDRSGQSFASMGTAADAGEQALREAVDGACASGDALEAAIEQARVDLFRSTQDLQAALDRLRFQSNSRVMLTSLRLMGARQDHVALVEQTGEAMAGHAEQLASEVSARLDQGVHGLRDEACPPARDEVDRLGVLAEAARDTAQAETETVTESFAVVRGKLPALQAGVEAVREAASRLGLAWP